MNILVTGRDGQLGSELQELAKTSKHNFVFVGSKDGDITNKDQIQELVSNHNIQAIINCAAYTAVDKAETEQDKAFLVNREGVQNLVAICAESNCKLIHISTDYVFPGNGTSPYKTNDPVAPLGVYGASKLAGEEAILNSDIDGIVIRTSWVYSTFGHNFVKTMTRLGKERDSLNVVNDQRGCPTYAKDLGAICLQLLDETWNSDQRIYHFSNSGEITWFDFATEIMKLTGSNCKVLPVPSSEFPTPAKRPSYSVMNTSELKKDFGIAPRNWKQALEECISQL
ncbi:dTDP-4-dehydrorhamnose reductase [Crocinitomicaceae bacterium]|nr:dTDP-4-dehydrorhamnose reductase [Crocinitomicaceae bacterium]